MKLNVPTIKRISAYSVIVILLSTIAVISITSCSRKVMPDEEASHWIAAFTPPHIDMDSKIRIEMTDAMKARIDTTQNLSDCFDFSPSAKGTAQLSKDKRFIDFIPEKSLKQGKKYECRLKMNKLVGVDSVGDFKFDFVVDKRELRLKDVVAAVDPDDISMMSISGTMEYNVQSGDSLTSDGTILICDSPSARIIVDSKAANKSRRFSISGIKRQSKTSEVKISTNPMSGFSRAEETVEIPSIEDFRLLNARRIDAAEPYISLDFSSPLSSQQELDGLIVIDRVSDIRIECDGCNVKVYYPQNAIPQLTLRLSELIKNREGRSLDEDIERSFKQEVIPPAVEIPFEGTILPDNNNLRLPFRAVNLAAVDVEIVKIFPGNVMSFLQENDLDGSYELRRFGRLVYHKTVRLDNDKSLNLHQWQNFSIDLKGLFRRERGAIYNIRLTFRKAYSLYNRTEPEKFEEVVEISDAERDRWDENHSYIYRDNPDYDWAEEDWREKDDPTKPSYYMYADMPEKNVVASTLGLIVKKGGNNEYVTTVTDLINAYPASGIEVVAYNYQLQKVASSTTDGNGFATLKVEGRPFMITASDGQSTTYLKVTSGRELSTSNFDVSGKEVTDGVKGFTYGDRGVWRPGDEIHLTLILEDKQHNLPKNLPLVMELYNPSDQLYTRKTLTEGVDGFYVFNVSTEESVPAGSWDAQFKVGNQTFHHKVRIETIKPNRLKINATTPDVIQANTPQTIGLDARWLTGPVARDMSASMEMTLFADPNPFAGYKKYSFSNPLVTFSSSQKQLFTGQLDSIGSLKRLCTVGADANSPGMLRANITAKVTEPGGDASITSRSVPFSPFGVYVGIDLTAQDYLTDTDLKFPVVVVNQKGARMKTRELSYKIYRLDWNWWWEGSADDLSRYVKSSSADLVAHGTVTATDGITSVPFRVNYPDWGKYLILVRDSKGGHATGGTVLVDWPEWRGRANRADASASTELSFTLDKKSYEAGETANVYLPKCKGSKVLLSIENGSEVIRRYWVSTSADKETCFKLPVDGAMAPNFYVSATMLRPHSQTANNVPIRLYGVAGASVIDKRTILHPEIEMPDELHPQQSFTIKVREQDNKPMTYTLAIVDEGLLDITNFKTPRPWYAMYQREALGVKTWDMYDDVIGAFGSKFTSVLSIGGDEALRKSAGKEKRFNPVVKFIGPFTLKGGAKTHKITLPNYVGSVRVMVIAAHEGCYGNTDKTVKVTSPLMLLTSLPRTLACGDAVEMPVNVFAMKEDIKDVSVNVETTGPVTFSGVKSKRLVFTSVGEKLENFHIACNNSNEGKARIVVTATSGNYRMSDTTFIDVKSPMPVLVNVEDRTLKAGESTTLSWNPAKTKSASLQIASMPTINFSGSMEFIENYPHLCSEQLSSKAIFMLFGRQLLNQVAKEDCESALPKVLNNISARQLSDGGFVYWPGNADTDSWVTSMAGIALVEADRQGFSINRTALDKWIEYQEKAARDYRYSEATDLDQAFRLYSLALAGKPMKSAMNRLRESKKLTQTAAYCLASAYAVEGRSDVAPKLIKRAERTPYAPDGGMFQSSLRDEAIKLNAYVLAKNSGKALSVARSVAKHCSGNNYVTQDIAFATMAIQSMAKLVGNGDVSFKIAEKGHTPISLQNISGVKNIALSPGSGNVSVTNTGKVLLELSLTSTYQPSATDKIKVVNNGLQIKVAYTDMKGKPISVAKLKQDTEFYAKVTVINTGGDVASMAMTYAIPSGWEIWNTRLFGSAEKSVDYCDIRDDRVSFYSSLTAGKKITFNLRLRAAYIGRYILPPVVCEDMYNPSIRANTANSWVSVVK